MKETDSITIKVETLEYLRKRFFAHLTEPFGARAVMEVLVSHRKRYGTKHERR